MSTSELIVANPISQEEVEWVRSKHAGIAKTAQRIFHEALELGEWFVEAQDRLGIAKTKTGTWNAWLRSSFPEIGLTTIGVYMRLARDRVYLEREYALAFDSNSGVRMLPTISGAIRLLQTRDRKLKEEGELEHPPAVFEEPLQLLADALKGYVYELYQLKHLEAQIAVRIKDQKLSKRQIRQAVEWACQEHPEVKESVLKAFLG